jgi:transposase-like protein
MNTNNATNDTIRHLPRACADESAAVAFLEFQRWGDHPACVHCGSTNVYKMQARDGSRNKRFLWKCKDCGQQYTVRVGTVFEDSRIQLRHWAYAFWMACSSKKGVSALQISRMTKISYKSALFMMHRIRWAMTETAAPVPMTGTVEVDETYIGGKIRGSSRGPDKKIPVVAMVQRDGEVRAIVMPRVNAKNLRAAIDANIDKSARLMTDEAAHYKTVGKTFAGGHETVVHSRYEFARGDATTNTVEGFFSLLKRGVFGVFHNVSEQHLHRYVSEFAYKYNTRKLNDGERVSLAIQKSQGKRLMYKEPVNG